MTNINYLAVAIAAIAAFIASGAWYAGFGAVLARLNDAYADARPSAVVAVAEIARSAIVALVVAFLVDRAGVDGVAESIGFGAVLWVGFPVLILAGSVLHEKVPWKLAAIHAGDWLVKLLLITAVVGIAG